MSVVSPQGSTPCTLIVKSVVPDVSPLRSKLRVSSALLPLGVVVKLKMFDVLVTGDAQGVVVVNVNGGSPSQEATMVLGSANAL